MKTKYNKKVIAYYERTIDNEDFEVIVVDENELHPDDEKYYNVHVISERFQTDELNTLKLQEPHSCIEDAKQYFDKKYMISTLMEHFIWDRFYDEGILSVSVEIDEIQKH